MKADNIWGILLVADDIEDFILLFKLIQGIKGQSFFLYWITHPDASIDLFDPVRFDLAIIDYRDETARGLNLLDEIDAAGCNLPVVVMTSWSQATILNEGYPKSCAGAFLAKPAINQDLLKDAINQVVIKFQTRAAKIEPSVDYGKHQKAKRRTSTLSR